MTDGPDSNRRSSHQFISLQIGSMDVLANWVQSRNIAGENRKASEEALMKYAKRILALTLTMISTMAFAQLSPDQKVVANVPFEFTVANKVVPAGQWTALRAAMSGRTLLIRNANASITIPSFTLPDEVKTEPRTSVLVFKKYGDRYFLSAIKIEGERVSYRIPESKAEAELLSGNNRASEETIVASLK